MFFKRWPAQQAILPSAISKIFGSMFFWLWRNSSPALWQYFIDFFVSVFAVKRCGAPALFSALAFWRSGTIVSAGAPVVFSDLALRYYFLHWLLWYYSLHRRFGALAAPALFSALAAPVLFYALALWRFWYYFMHWLLRYAPALFFVSGTILCWQY